MLEKPLKHLLLLLGYSLCLLFASCSNKGTQPDPWAYGDLRETTIVVNIAHDLRDTVDLWAYAYTIIPNNRKDSEKIPVFAKGEYELKLKIDRPTVGWIEVDDEIHYVGLEPNKTTSIELNQREKEGTEVDEIIVNELAEGTSIHQFYLDKKSELGYMDNRIGFANFRQSYSTYNNLKAQIDSALAIEKSFFETYVKEHDLPEWFVNAERYNLAYAGPCYHTGSKSYNDFFRVFEDTLSPDYYAYLDHVNIDNSEAIYSTFYLWFLGEYFSQNVDTESASFKESSRQQQYLKRKFAALSGANKELSGDAQKYFKLYTFSDIVKRYTDSHTVDSLAHEYGIEEYQSLLSLMGTRVPKKNQALNLVKGDTIPLLLLVNTEGELESLKDYGNSIVYINVWATWCKPCIKNLPMLNEMIAAYKGNSEIKFINICMRSEREAWKKAIKKHQLEGINLYAAGNWNDKMGQIFSLRGIPQYVILDKQNILIENFAKKAPFVKSQLDEILESTM